MDPSFYNGYKYTNSEVSSVQLEMAGLGLRTVRLANLPPELPLEVIKSAMGRYGKAENITEEQWSNLYRYRFGNDIRLVSFDIHNHIPSHIYIAGNLAVVSYMGQPATCTHATVWIMSPNCPQRNRCTEGEGYQTPPSWAQMVESEMCNHPRHEGTHLYAASILTSIVDEVSADNGTTDRPFRQPVAENATEIMPEAQTSDGIRPCPPTDVGTRDGEDHTSLGHNWPTKKKRLENTDRTHSVGSHA
jgi:hypothetical protein